MMNKSEKRSTRTKKKAVPKVSIAFIEEEQMYHVMGDRTGMGSGP